MACKIAGSAQMKQPIFFLACSWASRTRAGMWGHSSGISPSSRQNGSLEGGHHGCSPCPMYIWIDTQMGHR